VIVNRARNKTAALVAALAVALSTLVVAPPASAAVSQEVTTAVAGGFRVDGARIRQSPDTTSSILGLGYTSQSANVRCIVPRPHFSSMIYLTNNATGVTGYVLADYVWHNGSSLPGC